MCAAIFVIILMCCAAWLFNLLWDGIASWFHIERVYVSDRSYIDPRDLVKVPFDESWEREKMHAKMLKDEQEYRERMDGYYAQFTD